MYIKVSPGSIFLRNDIPIVGSNTSVNTISSVSKANRLKSLCKEKKYLLTIFVVSPFKESS